MNSQFKKGVLELCVLSLLSKKDYYGYELINKISERIYISDGTIYPILRKLSKEDFFTTYLRESQEGPPRKYYKITDLGLHRKELLKREWFDLLDGINYLLEEGDEND